MKWIVEKLKKLFAFLRHLVLNPRFLLCFGIAWIITNGWSYIMLGLGIWWDVNWMKAVAGAYLAALWIPFTPEKIITVAIAFGLRRLIFPNDKKTEEQIKELKAEDKKTKVDDDFSNDDEKDDSVDKKSA